MTARRELARQAVEAKITAWMEKHPGKFWRIPDVANATNLPVPAVNNALRTLKEMGVVVRDERRKRRNGKRIPLYQFIAYSMPGAEHFTGPDSAPPSWLCPAPPVLSPEQIKGVRTMLGFTGNIEAKKALKNT
jgi:hypothetical protein